jgi:hypothetical protein
MNEISDLTCVEIEAVSGGIIPALALAFAVISAFSAGGYMVGKNMAERDSVKHK